MSATTKAKVPQGEPTLYHDAGRAYLELHALRAPVGSYLPKYQRTPEMYDWAVQEAVQDFERLHDVKVLQLGRSGRHICIADTPVNRKRYKVLQRSAIEAARQLWRGMRERGASVWPSEGF